MIDRPDETRRVENYKRFQLTDYKIDIPKLAKKKALKAALEKDGKEWQIAFDTCLKYLHFQSQGQQQLDVIRRQQW